MRPSLAFVHGIGDHRHVDDERRLWCKELATGARLAGYPDVAVGLEAALIPVQFVYYRDLFDPPGQQQGPSGLPLEEPEAQELSELLLSIIDQLGDTHPDLAKDWAFAHARALLVPQRQPQGPGAFGRRVVGAATSFLDLPLLRETGRWLSGRLLVSDLRQVTRYLSRTETSTDDQTLDERIRCRVLKEIGQGPVVVIAHSLGTVVTLEALRDFTGAVPLWVTIGSPIGMRAVVLPRLRPSPPRTPECVVRWLNFWDNDDVVAVKQDLESLTQPNSAGVLPVSEQVNNPGLSTHGATKYLAQDRVARPIAQALRHDRSWTRP